MATAEIPKEVEVQRFIIAIILLVGFFACFIVVFIYTKDMETAKTVLTFLAGAVTSVVSFFFGVKTAEKVTK